MGLRTLLSRLRPFGASDDGADGENDEEGTVWDAIPSWQYEGRPAEAGGIARGERERAVADIQSRAEAEADVSERGE